MRPNKAIWVPGRAQEEALPTLESMALAEATLGRCRISQEERLGASRISQVELYVKVTRADQMRRLNLH